ncbi:hypothetical protein FHS16_005557 [Paenibacillus endophyticus]|uniref:Uncharacterized protein n=1 Tax=Paenibacillus endophyticus TaxID=1294268 RepID=A0A7W5CEJ5_9BACL|nr:DUF3962 domain-containing protein [Paenibacillus endophyticus]MBB3155449.1 hypothetical protein [Paenibacillus endophyticus]
MPKIKDIKLRPLAWEVNAQALVGLNVFRMDMPQVWLDFLRQFQINPAEPYKLKIRIGNLALKLQSIFPEVIWMNDQSYWQQGGPWIVSTVKIPESMIMAFCMGWFQEQAFNSKTKVDSPQEPHEKELYWESTVLANVLSVTNEYQLIPALVANRFCQTNKKIPIIEGCELPTNLSFSQVHTKGVAECMSELINSKKGVYAYVIRLRMKTRGGDGGKRILHFSLGIRRFIREAYVTEKGCFVEGDTKSAMLVSLNNPFLRDRGLGSRSYAKIWFRRKGNHTRWVDRSDEIFWDVLWGKTVTSDEILSNPLVYEGADSDVQALVVYNRLFGNSKIGAGVGFPEKAAFFQLFCEELADWKPLEPMQELIGKKNKSRSYTQLPPLFSISPKQIVLEVWGSADLFKHTVSIFETGLYQGEPLAYVKGHNSFMLNCSHDVWLELIHKEATPFLGSLHVENYQKQAYEQRVSVIEKESPRNDKHDVVYALVEILRSDEYKPEGSDPKLAIREGFRRTGRITQFIHPENDGVLTKIEYRLLNAILDLLSDGGILDKSVVQLPPDINILGFDILNIKKRSSENRYGEEKVNIPVFTKFAEGVLYVRGWGMDNWLSLQEAMLNADRFKGWKKIDESKITQLLDEVLRDELWGEERHYILLNADLRYLTLP